MSHLGLVVHTSAKFTKGVFGVPCSFLQLKQAPGVVHDVLLVFRVHRVHLSVLTALIKERTEEELSKPGNKPKISLLNTASQQRKGP